MLNSYKYIPITMVSHNYGKNMNQFSFLESLQSVISFNLLTRYTDLYDKNNFVFTVNCNKYLFFYKHCFIYYIKD